MAIYAYLFDADGQDRQVRAEQEVVDSVGDSQILWIDLSGEERAEYKKIADLLQFPLTLQRTMRDGDGKRVAIERPCLDLYGGCFHLNVDVIQEKDNGALKRLAVDFVVFPNIVVTLHERDAEFLENFDRRIKGDTHLGGLDGCAFLGAILNWHVTSFFRVLESLEAEVDRIDDAAFRLKNDRNLLSEMVRARRRVALVRQTLLPHREVYATLARPNFAAFVTEEATETLGLAYERMERAVEATENARELVLGSFDIFTTQTALRTNEVVKVLTLVSSILLPAGVLVNLSVLFIKAPVYEGGRATFWEMISFILLIGLVGVTIARRRKWL